VEVGIVLPKCGGRKISLD